MLRTIRLKKSVYPKWALSLLFVLILALILAAPSHLSAGQPDSKKSVPFLTFEQWTQLTDAQRQELINLAQKLKDKKDQRSFNLESGKKSEYVAILYGILSNVISTANAESDMIISPSLKQLQSPSWNLFKQNYYEETKSTYEDLCLGMGLIPGGPVCDQFSSTLTSYENLQKQGSKNASKKKKQVASPTPAPSDNQTTGTTQSTESPQPQTQAPAIPTEEEKALTEADNKYQTNTANRHKYEDEEGRTNKNDLKADRTSGGLGFTRDQGERKDKACNVSAHVDGAFKCDTTVDGLKNTQTYVQMSSVVMGMGTQVVGMQASANAQQSGSMSGAANAAADAQSLTGKAQLATGAITTVFGVMDYMRGRTHANQQEKLDSELAQYNGTGLVDTGAASPEKNSVAALKENKITDVTTLNEKQIRDLQSTGREEQKSGFFAIQDKEDSLAGKVMGNTESFGNFNDSTRGLQKVSSAKDYVELKKLKEQALASRNPAAAAYEGQMQTALASANNQLALRNDDYKGKFNDMKKQLRAIGSQAASEQGNVADMAKGQGIQTAMIGASQMIGGYANLKSAQINKDTANKMATIANTPTWNFPGAGDSGINPGDALAPAGSNAISPGASGDGSSAAGDDQNAANKDTYMGDPVGNQNPTGLANQAPPPPSFKTGDASAPGGGPGGGLGGGSTSPSTGGGEENPGPRLADGRGIHAYEGGGGGAYRGGGAAGGGDKGPDLSGMLAQFLPKGGEEAGNKNGILDYGGDRGPAGGDENASLLDRNINIFERVHQTYQEKQLKKRVGI